MAKVEVREVETVTGETSPSGDSTRTDKAWQLGAEVDGVWLPFATRSQGDFDHAKQRQDAAEAASGEQSGETSEPTDAK